MNRMNRRVVMATGGLAVAHGSLALSAAAFPPIGESRRRNGLSGRRAEPVATRFPSTDPELVSGVVGAAHSDLDGVVELVTPRPHLARAAVDWGFGDWESALGAASHMGRRDIAEFLIEQGARPDIFSAAMLGQLGAVRGLVEASPGVQRIPGPHGFSLLHHARRGGEQAVAVVEYLEGLGDADEAADRIEQSEEQLARFLGTYRFEASERSTLQISEGRFGLSLALEGAPFGRNIFPVSDNEFFPAGSPTVRIVFEVVDESARAVTIIDSEVLLEATRVG